MVGHGDRGSKDGDVHASVNWLAELMSKADKDIVCVDAAHVSNHIGGIPQIGERELIAGLAAAIAAAARAAGRQLVDQDPKQPHADRKLAVDGAATLAAESVLSRRDFRIIVSAGEGERDHSPGARSGQAIGSGSASSPRADGVFDYVDGTELAVNGEPGALALGAIGRGVRDVPDLQAFAVIAPKRSLNNMNLTTPFEECASRIVVALANSLNRPVGELTILTHSLGSHHGHQELIAMLKGTVREVLVPPKVSVEPPYFLSLVGLTHPRIDALIGGIGLSELSYAATLLDLIAPEFGIKFRLASVEGPRISPDSTVLDSLLNFTPKELLAIERHSFSSSAVYREGDLLSPGSAIAATMFAVTPNLALGWRGASETYGREVTGLLALPNQEVINLQIGYQI